MSRKISTLDSIVCVAAVCVSLVSIVSAVNIETVSVGNAGNAADSTNYGAVSYDYNIGKYEVTASQYTEFLNAVAATDTYSLYNTNMWSNAFGCKIERSGSSGNYTYSVAADYANRPVNYVSWGDAARFANWLHNGQPTGVQDLTTTEDGAYYLNGATSQTDLMAVVRESDWTWAITSENEWYKAAYHKNDGVTGNYFDYATGSDTLPSNTLADPDPGNNANFKSGATYTIGSPYYRTEVGAFANSNSPYGTFDQNGNVSEWTEGVAFTSRVYRDGSFYYDGTALASSYRTFRDPTGELITIGFRVSTLVPEPGTMGLLALGSVGLLLRRWKSVRGGE